MAKNYKQKGDVLTFTAPGGGVVSGNLYIIGGIAVVALTSAAAGATFSARADGVFELPKATGANTDLTEGQTVFWDAATSTVKRVSASGLRVIGCAVAAAAVGDAVCRVSINWQPLPAVVP